MYMPNNKKEQSTDTIELRIDMTEELIRELLWRALAPQGIVMTSALSDAIAQQEAMRDISLDKYQLTGISVTVEPDTMHAELTYTPLQSDSDARA
jgi:hypothetical protein